MEHLCNLYAFSYNTIQSSYDFGPVATGTILYCFVFLGSVIPYNAFLFLCYHYDWFSQYRIQRQLEQHPSEEMIKKSITYFTLHYIIMLPFLSYLFIWGLHSVGVIFDPNVCPEFFDVFLYQFLAIFMSETIFYWAHRIFHHRLLYKRFHKKHHEFKATIGLAFVYASEAESLLANSSNVLIPAFILKGHLLTFFVWVVIRSVESIDAHSGYQWPVPFPNWWFATFPCITGGADRHDFHHSHNTGMFGSFTGFWDWIMGTDKQFFEYLKNKTEEQTKKGK